MAQSKMIGWANSNIETMQCRSATLVVLTRLAPAILRSASQAVTFVKQIGVGWQADKSGWMGFVVFQSGRSHGPGSARRRFRRLDAVELSRVGWSSPVARPTDISEDFKFYAGFHGVWEVDEFLINPGSAQRLAEVQSMLSKAAGAQQRCKFCRLHHEPESRFAMSIYSPLPDNLGWHALSGGGSEDDVDGLSGRQFDVTTHCHTMLAEIDGHRPLVEHAL